MDISALDARYVWHPFTPLQGSAAALEIVRASGAVLHTACGREIIDAIGSWWVNLHGHAHPKLIEAICLAGSQLGHVLFAGFTHAPAALLCKQLSEVLPAGLTHFFFSDDGSTAIEVALKMAFQYWYNLEGAGCRTQIIALEGAYHGDTFGAMSVGERSPFNQPFGPMLFGVEFVEPPLCSDPLASGALNEQEKNALSRFEIVLKSGQIAAFIYEPLVQGASGMRMYRVAWLEAVLVLARKHNVLCIADEVMTGFGRTGVLFASDHLPDCPPDIICLSKGLTGGMLPLGLSVCNTKVQAAYQSSDLLKTFFHGHSFTATPMACAAALASLELLLGQESQADRLRIEQANKRFAAYICRYKAAVAQVRTIGVILAIEIRTSHQSSYINEARHFLYTFFLDKNILIRPLGNVIYILPPYIISNQQLDYIYQVIEQVVIGLDSSADLIGR